MAPHTQTITGCLGREIGKQQIEMGSALHPIVITSTTNFELLSSVYSGTVQDSLNSCLNSSKYAYTLLDIGELSGFKLCTTTP